MKFNIATEEGCKYIEAILPYGLDVKVTYSSAYMTIDYSDEFAHNIEVIDIPGQVNGKEIVRSNLSALTQELLKDPEFQAGVMKLIDQHLRRLTNSAVILK